MLVLFKLETEGKINFPVTWFVTQRKLSLIFTKALLFPNKTAYFWNDSHGSYKNADRNSNFHLTKFLKMTFSRQPMRAGAEIKVSVGLANK